MSVFLRYRVFKGPTVRRFRQTVSDVAEKHGGKITWDQQSNDQDTQFYSSHNKTTHTLVLPSEYDGNWLFCEKIGAELDVPWIEIRIQDSALWDYSFYSGSEHLHCFSTLPEYWDNSEPIEDTTANDAKQLASVWKVRHHRIRNYIRRWGYRIEGEGKYTTVLSGRAYSEDEHPYGDFNQIYDFLRALGSIDPHSDKRFETGHTIECPPIKTLQGA